ncbi:MAG: hypothetical protein RSA70_05800 [Clostridia bacterium]
MFKTAKRLVADVPPTEYLAPTSGVNYVVGGTLKLANGKAAIAAGTDKAEFICRGPINDDGLVPALRVTNLIEFETTAPSNLAVGTIVTLSPDGLSVTATATGGTFKVTCMCEDLLVRGIFIA